jgi:hypothetical protein
LSRSLARIIPSRDLDLLNLGESQQPRRGRNRDEASFHGRYQFGCSILKQVCCPLDRGATDS